MGYINCPVCEEIRKINDWAEVDQCWWCGWLIPVDPESGEYLRKEEWPPVTDQDRARLAARGPMS